nr:uncharacterized mitochondrial protein AtMg00810-like [Tanacetum cinerariifolium]
WKEAESVQQYVLRPLWSSNSKDPQNIISAFFEVKEPESEVHVSPSSSDKTKKHDGKTKREAKGNGPVEFTLITAVWPNSTNSTNSFSAAGPFNTTISPTFEICRKSSFMDLSQYPDDPNMPELEDITYLDDEEDVGAEADFSNLESSISVSHIPTTRVHKDHPITQIIGDLSSAPQTEYDQDEPKRVLQALKDPSWIEAMQEELLQLKMQKGHTQEEGIDYEEVFALVARIEAIWLFLAYASFMGFMVYKMVKALYGLHQAPRAWYETLANYLLENGFQRDRKSASTPIDSEKLLLKDPDGEDVDVYTYMSMIGSLMYLTFLRPDIMFVVYACAHFQVTPKASHLHAVKRIFRYLKGKPHLGLWYLKDSPFNLVAYSDSDYAGASMDRKSTTGGCQFLCCRLISWQCKKQTVVATSSIMAEYIAAASCCAQVLWIQN